MDLTIVNAKKEHLPAIIKIANTQLGKDYLTNTLTEAPHNKVFLLKIALDANSTIAGFYLMDLKKEALLKSISVSPNFENKGIATLLISDCINFSKTNNYNSLQVIAWQNNGKVQLQGILNHFNFIEKQKLPNYWQQDSLEKKYDCPTCGSPPCLCTAVVFKKILKTC